MDDKKKRSFMKFKSLGFAVGVIAEETHSMLVPMGTYLPVCVVNKF